MENMTEEEKLACVFFLVFRFNLFHVGWCAGVENFLFLLLLGEGEGGGGGGGGGWGALSECLEHRSK